MFSKTFEYSMRAVITLAGTNGESCTARRISEITHVPVPYLSKVLNILVRSGLVRSQRGLRGGFVLASSPDEIRILDIVEAVEPFRRIRECPLGLETAGLLCTLHRFLDGLMESTESTLRATTVADLMQDSEKMFPLCRVGRPGDNGDNGNIGDNGDESLDSEVRDAPRRTESTPTVRREEHAPGLNAP